MDTIISLNAEQTRQAARQLATALNRGSVVCLDGDLGVGKTEFVKGLVSALGSSNEVTSPTFPIVHEYICANGLPIFHIDLYRIDDERELMQLGLDEMFDQGFCTIVEWGGKFMGFFPSETLFIRIEHDGDGIRRITLRKLEELKK